MKIFNGNNKKWFLLTGGGFIPITNFPLFATYSPSSSLTPFINSLYTYAIGIAAILAVIEIIWGGFLWMGSGANVSNKEAGRSKILMAIFGLILVLSPYVILSVLNPNMLSLKLDSNNISSNINNNSTKIIKSPAPFIKSTICGPTAFSLKDSYGCSVSSTQKLLTTNGFSFCKNDVGNKIYKATATTKGPVCFSGYVGNSKEITPSIYSQCRTIASDGYILSGSHNTLSSHNSMYRAASARVIKVNAYGCAGVITSTRWDCKTFPPPIPSNYVCVYLTTL